MHVEPWSILSDDTPAVRIWPHFQGGSSFVLTLPEARELYDKLTPIVAPDPLIAECLETRRARELWEQGITSTSGPSSD